MRRDIVWVVAFGCCLLAATAGASDRAPYVWPEPPSDDQLKKAVAMKSDSGFVVLDRRSTLEIRSFEVKPHGVTKEEFVRFLIVSDEAARNATITVNDNPAAKIAFIEGRTIAPDRSVTPVDEKRDIKRLDVARLRKKELTASLADVAFPAPTKGAVLDLHYSTIAEGDVFDWGETLVFSNTPSLNADFEVTYKGSSPDVPWITFTVGDPDGSAQLTYLSSGAARVHLGPFTPRRHLAFDPPAHQLYPTLISTLDLVAVRLEGAEGGTLFRVASYVDARGRVTMLDFPTPRHREYWANFVTDGKDDKKFLDHDGSASSINVEAAAPSALPVRERAARLYALAQKSAGYNPDAEDVDTVSALMRKGMNRPWQGTLLYSYLLTRAKIPHRVGVVADRYAVRFLPAVRNEHLFGFDKVVVIDVPGEPPIYAMPGYLALPFGCLPDDYQDSVVLFAKGDKDVETGYTPFNAIRLDSVTTAYDVELNPAGDAAGKVTLAQSGAPGLSFSSWNRRRLWRQVHRDPNEKRSDAAIEKARKEEFDRRLADEFELPGNRLQLSDYAVASSEPAPARPVEATASAHGKGIATPAQGRWILYSNPVLAGFTSPFTESIRMTPIWYDKGGHLVVDGDVKLPAGATVVELPRPSEIAGPLGARASSKTETIERDGRVVVHTHLEFDKPSVVGSDQDHAWRVYQTELARIAQDRCIISMPEKKELE